MFELKNIFEGTLSFISACILDPSLQKCFMASRDLNIFTTQSSLNGVIAASIALSASCASLRRPCAIICLVFNFIIRDCVLVFVLDKFRFE